MKNGDGSSSSTLSVPMDALADGVLLEHFTARRDEAAFAAIMRRYGPLVFSVCRRVLSHQQDAEDAFQATFLVLARKADSITKRESVGSWLYGVAYRIARKAKTLRARRPVYESNFPDPPAPENDPEGVWRDLRPLLDEEVNRLPSKYRLPFVLHYLEGQTTEQAARQLGCPRGTVLSRLARARDLLRARLGRRGLAVPAALVAAALTRETAVAVVPSALGQTTLQAAVLFAGGQSVAAGAFSAKAVALADAFLKTLAATKWKLALAGLTALATVAAVLVFLWVAMNRGGHPGNVFAPAVATPKTDETKLQGAWMMSALEAEGQPFPFKDSKIVFANNRCYLTLAMGEGNPANLSWIFRCDAAKELKEIDLTDARGTTWRGIYSLEEDTFKLCYAAPGGERPTAFATAPNVPIVLYEFRRGTSAQTPAERKPGGERP